MRRIVPIILLLCLSCLSLWAKQQLDIPLKYHFIRFKPMDGPTGSTPDPTDPNQFRASLTGNTLTVHTQLGEASYVVVLSDFSDMAGEDYFYSLSTDSVTCTIDRPGTYEIAIGHWNCDLVGRVEIYSVNWYDFTGKNYGSQKPDFIPGMYYILNLKTDIGNTAVKYLLAK